MKMPDFYDRIKDSFGDYIVGIRLKYNHENRYRVLSEVLTVTDDGFDWLNDWFEGEQEVEILGYIRVDSIIFYSRDISNRADTIDGQPERRQKGGNMSIAKHNRRENRFKVDTQGFEFKKLGDLYDAKKPETVFMVYGLYINRKGKYGESPFAASDGYFISLPSHLTDVVKDILNDDDAVLQINNCAAGLVIRTYDDDKGVTHYTADFVDV